MRGNLQALFGKRPMEKDPAKGTSPAVDFTLRGPGAAMRPAYPAIDGGALMPLLGSSAMVTAG